MDGFGSWLPCTDGRVHYRLGRGCLCGARARPTGERAPELPGYGNGHNTAPDTSRDCPECKAANEARWSGLGAERAAG